MEFENELCTDNEHVIPKTYKLLLRFEMEGEKVKEYLMKWTKNFGRTDGAREEELLKRLKFTLCYNLKDNLNKIMYHWYMTPGKLSMLYKDTFNEYYKCVKHSIMHGELVKVYQNIRTRVRCTIGLSDDFTVKFSSHQGVITIAVHSRHGYYHARSAL